MDPVSVIVAALVAGSLRGIEEIGQQLVADGYQVLRCTIIAKYGPRARASIEQLEADPRSPERQEYARQSLRCLGVEHDCELQRLAARLADLVQNPVAGYEASMPSVSFQADPIEVAQRRAGTQVIGQIVGSHIACVQQIRGNYLLDDVELLSSSICHNASVPATMRDEIAGLHGKMRGVIEQIACKIEDGKYRDAEQAVKEMPLSFGERQRAAEIVQADKRMHVSYQALKITVDFFSELNQSILRTIEREPSPQKEAHMMLGNAIMIYELTDFVIRYIEGFTIEGASDINRLHESTRQKIADLRRQQKALEQRATAPGVEPLVRDQTLEDVSNREAAMDELEQEWERYLGEVHHLHTTVGEVRGKLQTLELIRENAKVQISLIQIVAMLQFLKRNTDTIKGTVDALQGFRLAPLSPNRVRRLLGIS